MTLYQNVLENPEEFDFTIQKLGERAIPSPIKGRTFAMEDRVLFSQRENALRKLLAENRSLTMESTVLKAFVMANGSRIFAQ